MRAPALLGLTILATQPAIAAEGRLLPHTWGLPGTTTTLEDVDFAIEQAKLSQWSLSRSLPVPWPEMTGGTFEQDIAQYLLTDRTLDTIATLRSDLARSIPPDGGAIPATALEPMKRILIVEDCKRMTLILYWSGRHILDYHGGLLSTLAGHLPTGERPGAAARLRSLEERARALHEQMAPDIQRCESADEQVLPALDLIVALADEFNATRIALAEKLDLVKGTWPAAQRTREQACPPTTAGATTGTPRASVRNWPNPSDYYPQDERIHSVEGGVRVVIEIDASGCVIRTSIAQSTGSLALDEAGMRMAFDFQFTPGEIDGKVAEEERFILPISFRMREFPGALPGALPAQPQP